MLKVFRISDYDINYEVNLNISGENIILKTNYIKDNKPINGILESEQESIINFSDLKKNYNYSGLDRWSIGIERNGQHKQIVNIFAETSISKIEAEEYAKQVNTYFMLQIVVRPEDTSFEDSQVRLYITENSLLKTNVSFKEEENIKTPKNQKSYLKLDNYSISEISREEDNIILQINAPETVNNTFYAKSNAGVVQNKIEVVNGVGRFVFSTIGMVDGSEATIKVGLKYFSNLFNINITK